MISIKAEVKMALTIVHHNHKGFIRLSDHLTPFIQAEFKGSRATENFSCRRTKTATIVNCLGDYYQIELIGDLKNLLLSASYSMEVMTLELKKSFL